jgi:hypothetical protein
MNAFETRALKFSFIFLIGEILFSCLLWNVQKSNVTLYQELNVLNEKLQTVLQNDSGSLHSRRLSSSFADELSQCCCVAPTMAPTYIPTVVPSITPSQMPTFTPTVFPTCVPTMAPTYIPTVVPSIAPSQLPTFTPTVFPTCAPTFAPTGYAYIRVITNFNGTSGNDYVEIDSTVDVTITGGGGNDRYLVLPHSKANITVTDFSNGFNTLDLSNFAKMTDYYSVKAHTTLTDYATSQSKVTLAMNYYRAVINLQNSQFVILQNLPDTFQLTATNFAYFTAPSTSPTQALPEITGSSPTFKDNSVTKAAIAAATSLGSALLGLIVTWFARKVIAFRIIEKWGHTFKIYTKQTFPDSPSVIYLCCIDEQIHCNFSDRRTVLLKGGSENNLQYDSLLAITDAELSPLEIVEIRTCLMSNGLIPVVTVFGCLKSYQGLPPLQGVVYYNCLNMFGTMHQEDVITGKRFGNFTVRVAPEC